jgi:hypothetical protein
MRTLKPARLPDPPARKASIGVAIAATLVAGLCAAAGPGPERVLLLYNANWTADEDADGVQDSLQVAQYYAAKRGVPAQNLLGLACTTAYRYETTQYALFHQQVVAPITNRLAALGPVTCRNRSVRGIALRQQGRRLDPGGARRSDRGGSRFPGAWKVGTAQGPAVATGEAGRA